ncbi:molybdopterin oxidoreductase [Denitrobacterium detoxificans]|uniref:Nitrate reductase n=1 Tax=Denitrobacterium detoxificans TaxID=79604 RepID=A0A172RZV3_9ACTN|nr:molybdopterin-dependent oxidoreductase [Denitrobacterium detoxificans]ANE23239.1 molybdopterin oxidoreductase [Denitrobacterium detoxificans]SEO37300.1 nitrate reductase NapA [Denitrobacterium detoxificans]
MDISRRAFIKSTAVAMAMAAAAGASVTGCAPKKNDPLNGDAVKTTLAVCRFCGCGCGVIVESMRGKVVSVYGDPENDSNRGLNCVKGYYLSKVLYGEGRLTTPLIRDDNSTKGTEDGFREATWEEALDLVASKLRETWKADKSRLAFWGSGQQPILEGYATAKFWKAGLRSNNIDPNARLCMASAVVGFMNVFQTDEPAGCYADIDHADVFITWGANMAEAHPMLYSRLMARKIADPQVKHYDVTTLGTRTAASADRVIMFGNNGDLAITNCIAHYLIENDTYDHDFVADHLQFKQGTENIGNANYDGYDKSDIGQAVDTVESISFEEYAARLAPYTWEYASEISGASVEDLQALYELFANPELKVTSFWTMGVNQHNRGTWMNHNLHNLHLLSGKYCKPGNGGFSLTGQPSACGTAREVGTFSHRLPADLVVANPAHRRYSEAVWNLPEGYLEDIAKPGYHTTKMFRELSNGNIDFLWSAHNNWAQSMTNLTRFLGRGAEDKRGIFDAFIVVSEVFPTMSTKYANVVLPAAMWIEREGAFGNGERRTAVFEQAVTPPGDARWDMWMLMEIAKRVLAGEEIGGEDAFDVLFGEWYDKDACDFRQETQREVCKSMWEEYRTFSNPKLNPRAEAINRDSKLKMEAKQLAPYEEYIYNHGMTWPVREVNGEWLPTKWRFSYGLQEEGYDQYGVEMYGDEGLANDVSFYKSTDHRPSVVFRPWEPPAEVPDSEYPFVFCTGRLLEHWHTGTMTRRVPALHNALPEALLDMNEADMAELGIKDGDRVRLVSRWGEVEITASSAGRTKPPARYLFAPFFAEETLINLVQQEAYCPLSKEPDFKKTCVRVEKL